MNFPTIDSTPIFPEIGEHLESIYLETDDKTETIVNTQIDENQEEEVKVIEEIQMEGMKEVKYEIPNNILVLENHASSHEIENIEQSNDKVTENKSNNNRNGNVVEFMTKVDQYVVKYDVLNESYKCPLCNKELPWYGEGVTITLDNCNHVFCGYCVSNLLENIINYKTVELQCPYPECNVLIDQEKYNIEEMVDPILYKKYLIVWTERSNNGTESRIFRCKTFLCDGWCVIEGYNVTEFLCPICKKNNNVNVELEQNKKDEIGQEQIERYKELVALMENKMVPNFEPFECPICLISYKPLDGLVLKNCLHTFCKECISNTVNFSEDVDVKCPYKDNNYSCNAIIEQCEIKEVKI
ncbi:ranBP-type and C3HC4-type zinc finger-containing protein 1-like [Polistes fuscatus]|uniref:ranBP-type and C3HC4-type zinc finger-containing protein 1-like n=1 Tax=Polistes fuscatus TaxID=30207 RepID=UPI001CA9734B|nr:ranBP-type and C3HC4-type zinc finger-containing protein 1-like [Polistes fuscatus]